VEHHRIGESRMVRHVHAESPVGESAIGESEVGGSGGGAWRSGRGKKRISRSSTWGSSSHGTSSMMRVPALGSWPPRPPTKMWTPSTTLPSTLTLHTWRHLFAVWRL